jgi:hypothetical protein
MIFAFMTFDESGRVLLILLIMTALIGRHLWKKATEAINNNPEMRDKAIRKGSSMLQEYLRNKFGL